MMCHKVLSLSIFFYVTVIFLAMVNSGCSRNLPEIELGSITEFSESGNRFSVDVKNSNLGWFLGLYMKDIEDDQTLLDAQFTITIHNTSETQLGTSFRQTYLTIMPGKEEIVYKGSFRDFWYEGGALIIHNNETKLTYSVVVNSEYQSVLKNPIRLYLYTRDAPIFP